LPEVSVNFVPEEKGVESLARQIRLTGRAYPVFDIAHLILKRPDRYHVVFGVVKKPDGQIVQQLWGCNLDDTLWLSEQEAVNHVLRKHFDTFYQAERTPTDPPKGTYTFVAQCSLSGLILGPPNYHDYQNKLRKLHAERFARMPFEAYKARVRIVKDEAVVKKWIEEQSTKTEYNCLNVPEPKRLASREEVEQHFREVHFPNIIRAVESHTLSGTAAQQSPVPVMRQLLRRAWDDQQRFPLKVVTTLSQQLATHGLQFFKVNKTITHVAVARPHFLDLEATPVSDGVKQIVDFVNAHFACNRRQLIEALAPSAVRSPAPAPMAPAVAPATTGPAEGSNATEPAAESGATSAAPAPAAAPVPSRDLQEPTPEQTAIIADLHWLIHQGHVIEFANGKLETAKKPIPRPPKPVAKPVVALAQRPVAAAESAAADVEPTPDLGAVASVDAGSVPERDEVVPVPEAQPEAPAPGPGEAQPGASASAPAAADSTGPSPAGPDSSPGPGGTER